MTLHRFNSTGIEVKEADPIGVGGIIGGSVVGEGGAPAATVDQEEIVAAAADEGVVTASGDQHVVTVAARETVAAPIAFDPLVRS